MRLAPDDLETIRLIMQALIAVGSVVGGVVAAWTFWRARRLEEMNAIVTQIQSQNELREERIRQPAIARFNEEDFRGILTVFQVAGPESHDADRAVQQYYGWLVQYGIFEMQYVRLRHRLMKKREAARFWRAVDLSLTEDGFRRAVLTATNKFVFTELLRDMAQRPAGRQAAQAVQSLGLTLDEEVRSVL